MSIAIPPQVIVGVERALGVLSLDLSRELYAPMGLELIDEERARGAIREGLSVPREEGARDEAYRGARVRAALESLQSAFGEAVRDYLVVWIRDVFLADPGGSQGFLWRRLVRRVDNQRRPPALIARVRTELARADRVDVPTAPQTAWDIDVLPEISASPTTNPMDIVALLVSYLLFARAWNKALSRALDTTAEIDEAVAWAEREVPRMGLKSEVVERPSTWPLPPSPP